MIFCKRQIEKYFPFNFFLKIGLDSTQECLNRVEKLYKTIMIILNDAHFISNGNTLDGNIVDPDEIPHKVATHHGLHC